MGIAWHMKHVCVYHNIPLQRMRIAGFLIPFCIRCANKTTNNARRAEKVNSAVNMALGKEDLTKFWKHKQQSIKTLFCANHSCKKEFQRKRSSKAKFCSVPCRVFCQRLKSTKPKSKRIHAQYTPYLLKRKWRQIGVIENNRRVGGGASR